MKKHLWWSAIPCAIFLETYAQPALFKTSAAFASRETVAVGQIEASSPISPKKIIIQNGDTKTTLLKKAFYGYRDAGGVNWRFYRNENYQILDTAFFYLYKRTALEPNGGGKGFSTQTRYYFSRNASNLPEELTASNLEKAFATNRRFHHEMDSYVRSGYSLIDYDPYEKTYKVKYLYKESLR